ncbi:hypothetical protein SAMN05444157_2518 [Frankineae bacterium MT45]|nr:hypothetical protein SAMN05444157_2518 [Frankineae bacterium MT45]
MTKAVAMTKDSATELTPGLTRRLTEGTPTRRTLLKGGVGGVAALALGATAVAVAGSAVDAPAAGAANAPQQDCSVRYLGYQGSDWSQPYASFFAGRTRPPQPQITAAFAGPATPTDQVPLFSTLPDEMNSSGYSAVETGYGMASDGTAWAAALTTMPGVSAAMWDWWFGWHSTESARYKLWHPDAHAYASLHADYRGNPFLTDRQRYVGNTTYVDEYIGPYLEQLAIEFQPPTDHGIKVPNGSTVIYGRVGSSVLPVDLGYLCHQVRPIPGGVEMRSRFFLNKPGLHLPDPGQTVCAVERGAQHTLDAPLPFNATFAADLMQHCGAEMNHLANILPQLYRNFRTLP